MFYNFVRRYSAEISGALACLVSGIVCGYLFRGNAYEAWYLLLAKPSYTPPQWVFAPVWTVLYILMGVALGKLWKNRSHNKLAVAMFALQFVYNMMWTPLFFHLRRIDLALIDIFLLLGSLVALMYLVRRNRPVFLLLLPYVLWVAFATLINFNIYSMNVM